MSFQWPFLLPLLAIVPLSAAALRRARAAPRAVRRPLHEPRRARVGRRRAARLAPLAPARPLLPGARRCTARADPAGGDGRSPQRERKRHPHHRQLGLDVREGRASHAAGGCPGSRAAVPRQASRSLPRRRRDVLLGGPGRRAADARPPGRARRGRLSVPRTRHGDRGRAREIRRARRAGARDGARRDRRGAGRRAGRRRLRTAGDRDPHALGRRPDSRDPPAVRGCPASDERQDPRLHGRPGDAGRASDVRSVRRPRARSSCRRTP